MPAVVCHDESSFTSDGGCDHVRVARIGQCDATQNVTIRGNICTRKGLFHFGTRPVETGYRIAKFVAAASHPLFVDGIRPDGAESASFSDPQQEVTRATSEQDTCVQNCGVHNVTSPLGSVAMILGIGGEGFE